ncbi:TetR/AcrR family transcriptional regulator [Neobacillus niacini]|uniref:TetR/AcrR family transcriptional regulator n=1 Tax=Neobacillus niacini TaxID=86668 RepID=UPI0021CB72E5|nr:TetR/AcrR family transcriptional regulator [Neobacillus niacini]MCM3765056.1 TetR/AcrR family transcriptional regulator [Neobacillus niacini]
MSTNERRKKEIKEMKQEIIEAAVQLFLSDGYENVSMRKIAKKIQYSPTAIYNYFASKEEILKQLLMNGYSIFLNSLKEGVAKSEEDALSRLKASLNAYIHFGLSHPDYYRLIFIENLHLLQKIIIDEDDRTKGFQLLTELVAEAMNEGVLKKNEVQLVSQSLWASLHGITALLITFPDFGWSDFDGLIRFQVEAMIKGVS